MKDVSALRLTSGESPSSDRVCNVKARDLQDLRKKVKKCMCRSEKQQPVLLIPVKLYVVQFYANSSIFLSIFLSKTFFRQLI